MTNGAISVDHRRRCPQLSGMIRKKFIPSRPEKLIC
jgi:hypothetical protein